MVVNKIIKVPSGHICIMDGDRGKLEFLSIADYGRNANVKADFLGLKNDINGVPNGDFMPLSEKWVITLSTQYGCSMGCKFCDVPKVGPGVNATLADLTYQITSALSLNADIDFTKRLNIHYARMGEPSFNRDVLIPFIQDWCEIKNDNFRGCAGLQFSINSTSDYQRDEMFSDSSLSLKEISKIGEGLPDPVGRKYALNFALADNYEVDGKKLASLFDPQKFMVKITPLHVTNSSSDNNIVTTGGYEEFTPYKEAEKSLVNAGFDTLVFVPSHDEDRGRITCGNAILSGTMPECDFKIIKDDN